MVLMSLLSRVVLLLVVFFFQAEDGIRDLYVTGVQTCALPICWCELLPPFVRAVRSVCWMPMEPASNIVHALKYEGWSAVARELAERMSRLSWPRDVVDERKALIPVPLASARKRQRGYNQSALIAKVLGERWRLPVWENAVQRTRETGTQTRLTPEERRANVAGSFCVTGNAGDLSDAHLIIVDDVVTTAASPNSW